MALDKYRENLRTILTHRSILAHGPKILLVTPPPVNEVHLQENDFAKGYSALTRVQKVTAQYADVVRELATEFKDKNVVLVDLWTALMKEGAKHTPGYVEDGKMIGTLEKGDNAGLRTLLLDGLHLTAAGYKVFLNEVLPFVGPGWAQESELEHTPGYVEDGKMIGTLEKGDNAGLRTLLLDGLHLTAAGYKVFLNEVLPFVGPGWAQESELDPKWVFP